MTAPRIIRMPVAVSLRVEAAVGSGGIDVVVAIKGQCCLAPSVSIRATRRFRRPAPRGGHKARGDGGRPPHRRSARASAHTSLTKPRYDALILPRNGEGGSAAGRVGWGRALPGRPHPTRRFAPPSPFRGGISQRLLFFTYPTKCLPKLDVPGGKSLTMRLSRRPARVRHRCRSGGLMGRHHREKGRLFKPHQVQ